MRLRLGKAFRVQSVFAEVSDLLPDRPPDAAFVHAATAAHPQIPRLLGEAEC